MSESPSSFGRLVSLACHDLRTPLSTVLGFARTLAERGNPNERERRYLELMEAAAERTVELLDELALAARIESGRWQPGLEQVDTLALARAAAERVEEGEVRVGGEGASALLDREPCERALAALAGAALRHGRLDELELGVEGTTLTLSPVAPDVGTVLLGADLRDLRAAIGTRVLEALGGCLELDAERLLIRLPRGQASARPGASA